MCLTDDDLFNERLLTPRSSRGTQFLAENVNPNSGDAVESAWFDY